MSTNAVRYRTSLANAATPLGLMRLTSGDNGRDCDRYQKVCTNEAVKADTD